MAESRLVRSTVVALFHLGSAAVAWCKPLPPLEVLIATAEWNAGDLLRAQVTVRFLTATEAARIVVRSEGALDSRPYSEEVCRSKSQVSVTRISIQQCSDRTWHQNSR